MKTKQEIEQLAESEYGTEIGSIRGSNPYDLEKDRKNGYIKGYTQCQEGMTYILKKAIEYGYELRNNHKPINSGIDWVKEFNKLNKQD